MQNNQYQIGIVALKPEDRKIYFNNLNCQRYKYKKIRTGGYNLLINADNYLAQNCSSDPIATLNDDCVIKSFFAAWFIDLHLAISKKYSKCSGLKYDYPNLDVMLYPAYWSDILDVMQNNQYQIGIVALKPEDRKIYFITIHHLFPAVYVI